MARSNPTLQTREVCGRRDNARCVRCGRSLVGVPASLHHRRLRSHPFPGLHQPANLIWLDGSGSTGCHGWVHAHPAEAYRLGYMVHMSDDPASTPILRYDGKWVLLDNEGGEKIETIADTETH